MKRTLILFTLLSLLLAACGTVATPVFEADLQETQVAAAATSAEETANAPTSTATSTITPTATDMPPPTETPTEAPTEPPTATELPPTEAPTEAPADDSEVTGDPAAGETLFTTFVAQASFACNTCHLVDSESMLIGPGLLNVAERAETRVEGMSAEEYLRTSILHPSDYVVEGFPDMLMPQIYETVFSDEDVDNLIAYLMTLN